MKSIENFGEGYSDGDVDTNLSDNPTLESMVEQRYSRRQTILGGAAATTAAFLGSLPLAGCFGDDDEDAAPVVNAGASGTTSSGRRVTLAGTATDNGSIATTTWTQVSGPAVTLANASTNTANFIAPGVAASTALVFRFAATDNAGQTTSAETTVTVGPNQLSFTSIAKNQNDVVTVPAGYTVKVLYSTGDPIASGVPAYKNDGTDTNFAQRAGDHHDGMYYYGLAPTGTNSQFGNSTRGLLVMNHENINVVYLHPAGPTAVTTGPRPEAEAIKEIECHGCSVVEVVRAGDDGAWSYVQDSAFNRRVTPFTPVDFSGPVRGADHLKTLYSPTGVEGRGTLNNCAFGLTYWGTYLTCEENWAGYFKRPTTDNVNRTAKEVTALARYGVSQVNGNYAWATVTPSTAGDTRFARWNSIVTGAAATADFRNEHNQFGWVVEFDPYTPGSKPKKRTALGRLGHEGAWAGLFVNGRKPAFYLGDDSRNEYFYKFVSSTAWSSADLFPASANRMALGDKYLDAGTLYVAKFNADGTGTWMPLVFGSGPLTAVGYAPYAFADQADVLTHARIAADALGATKMDRPEWTATNDVTGEIYLTLTNNNTTRAVTATDAANPRWYDDPKGGVSQLGNPNGHILRLRETGDNSEATTFAWDIYAFGATSDNLTNTNVNLSGLDASNDFASPDGIWFGRPSNASGQHKPLLWIQTDDGSYTDVTNNQMLAALPGSVGDGGVRNIVNTSGGVNYPQATRVGAAPGTANLKRFLVGPKQCEITGIDSTPDGRTLFVNIQHPGEEATSPAAPTSNWPASQAAAAPGVRPRSATVIITKDDGGVVGL